MRLDWSLVPLALALVLALPTTATAQSASQLHQALSANAENGFWQLLDAADREWMKVNTYKAEFEKTEQRGGKVHPTEKISYRFMRDHGILMEWHDKDNDGKKVLYVQGKYDNMLSIKVKFFFWVHVTRSPTDSSVMEKTNHPITESGFGKSLEKIRSYSQNMKQRGHLTVKYNGQVRGPDGQQCFSVTRSFRSGNLGDVTVLFDCNTFMPIQIEAKDRKGSFLEKYTYKGVELNPKDRRGRPELTVRTFYRSTVFPGEWERSENWPQSDIAKDFVRKGGKLQ